MVKKILNWQIILGVILVVLSAVVYYAHFLIFHDAHHIFIYLLGDIAFVFLEVLIVTLVLHRLLAYREKQSILKKLNMVIGTFFSEIGVDLLKNFSGLDEEYKNIAKNLVISSNWSKNHFIRTKKYFNSYGYDFDIEKVNFKQLREKLLSKREFLLNLLANPNLLEHESFTNLLWAVFHLTEELKFRKDLDGLIKTDKEHLCGDIKRVYKLLISQWLDYMRHLQKDYPYLFSLAVRTNPFDSGAEITVK